MSIQVGSQIAGFLPGILYSNSNSVLILSAVPIAPIVGQCRIRTHGGLTECLFAQQGQSKPASKYACIGNGLHMATLGLSSIDCRVDCQRFFLTLETSMCQSGKPHYLKSHPSNLPWQQEGHCWHCQKTGYMKQ